MQIENKKARFEDLELSKLRALLDSIEREAKDAPLIIDNQNGSWLEWFEYLKDSTNESLKEIFARYNHIDTNLIKILTRIENSMFFKQWEILRYNDYDKSFGVYHEQIKMYLVLIADLQKYFDENLKEYGSLTSEFMGYKR